MFLCYPIPSSWYLSGSHRAWRVTNITFLEPTYPTISCYTCICIYLYVYMDAYRCTYIWFGVSSWFEAMLNLLSSLEPCGSQFCHILLRKLQKCASLYMLWWYFCCWGSKAITPDGRPCQEHPVLCDTEPQCSLLPSFLTCRTNWSKCQYCHMYNKAQSHWAENIQCFQKSFGALQG